MLSGAIMKAVLLFVCLFASHGHAKPGKTIGKDGSLPNVQKGANEFALNFYKTILENEPGNLIVSPLSVYMALAMASYGAKDATSDELQRVLHLPERAEVARGSLRQIMDSLKALTGVQFRLLNVLLSRSDFLLTPEYKHLLTDTFDSDLRPVYPNDEISIAHKINEWTASKTNNEIKKLVDPSALRDLSLLLVNAMYFSGKWQIPFNKYSTIPEDFLVNGKSMMKVPTMHTTEYFRTGNLPHLDASFIKLPYVTKPDSDDEDDTISMYIILPNKKDGLAKTIENIASLTLDDLNKGYEDMVRLSLPKFKFSSELQLRNHLRTMGIQSAFSQRANFGGMSNQRRQMHLDEVEQTSTIFIYEEGTGVSIATKAHLSPVIDPPRFDVNQPFLFVVATKGLILFAGKVEDPTDGHAL